MEKKETPITVVLIGTISILGMLIGLFVLIWTLSLLAFKFFATSFLLFWITYITDQIFYKQKDD